MRKTLNYLVYFGDIIAISLLFFYLIIYHTVALGSFLFEGYPDEKIVMLPSEWILPIIIFGALTCLYIKYLFGMVKYKKIKIYLLMVGFVISILFNIIWTLLSFANSDSNSLLVQLLVFVVMIMLLVYTNIRRIRLSTDGY